MFCLSGQEMVLRRQNPWLKDTHGAGMRIMQTLFLRPLLKDTVNFMSQMVRTGPLVCLVLSSVCLWIRVMVFGLEYWYKCHGTGKELKPGLLCLKING